MEEVLCFYLTFSFPHYSRGHSALVLRVFLFSLGLWSEVGLLSLCSLMIR